MKRILLFVLCVLLLVPLVSCGGEDVETYKHKVFVEYIYENQKAVFENWDEDFEIYSPITKFQDDSAKKNKSVTVGERSFSGEYDGSSISEYGDKIVHRYKFLGGYFVVDAATNKLLELSAKEYDSKNKIRIFSEEDCIEAAKNYVVNNFPELDLELYSFNSSKSDSDKPSDVTYYCSWVLNESADHCDELMIRVSAVDKTIYKIKASNFGMIGYLGKEKIEELYNSELIQEEIANIEKKALKCFKKDAEKELERQVELVDQMIAAGLISDENIAKVDEEINKTNLDNINIRTKPVGLVKIENQKLAMIVSLTLSAEDFDYSQSKRVIIEYDRNEET